MALAPELAIPALRFMFDTYGDRTWGKHGFKDAFNVYREWWDQDYLGIDEGVILLMIENHRSQLIWNEFITSPYVVDALASAGFVDEQKSDRGTWLTIQTIRGKLNKTNVLALS